MSIINPATYWRQNKSWSKYLGQRGVVVVATYLHAVGSQHYQLEPYSFAVIKLEDDRKGEKIELMGVGNEELKTGDRIECVLRRSSTPDKTSIIGYGIKAKKI